MVYVDRHGNICNQRPWTIRRLFEAFIGFFSVLWIFLRTMIEPILTGLSGDGSSSRYNRRGGGGGGGGNGNDRGPPRPPRRMGGFKTLSDCTPMPGGG